MSERIPVGWTTTRLGDFATEVRNGIAAKPEGDTGTPILRISAVRPMVLNTRDTRFLGGAPSTWEQYRLRSDDLLFTRYNGNPALVGVCARVAIPLDSLLVYPDKLIRVRLDLSVAVPAFVERAVHVGAARAFIDGKTKTSAGQVGISGGDLKDVPIPLAPLNEQRRIVAKLEALQARSRRARQALDAVPPLLEKLRQSVLAAAFCGDLTKSWRATNKHTEPATELLTRIRTERRACWEDAERAKMKAKGREPSDDKWKTRYKEPEPADARLLPVLPVGWCWASVDELCPGDAPAVYGIVLLGVDVSSGVPYVRPVDMCEDGTVDFDSIKRTTSEIAAQYARASLRTGDVVLSIVGTIGKVIIVPPSLDGANITQSSARIRAPAPMSSEYLSLALRSPLLVRQFDAMRFGNAVQRLNVEHVRQLAIPLAPQAEQTAIVRLAQRALQRVPSAGVAALGERLAELERSVLAKAFRGELVPQDPKDQPAAALLKSRVAAESAAPVKLRLKSNGKRREAAPSSGGRADARPSR